MCLSLRSQTPVSRSYRDLHSAASVGAGVSCFWTKWWPCEGWWSGVSPETRRTRGLMSKGLFPVKVMPYIWSCSSILGEQVDSSV